MPSDAAHPETEAWQDPRPPEGARFDGAGGAGGRLAVMSTSLGGPDRRAARPAERAGSRSQARWSFRWRPWIRRDGRTSRSSATPRSWRAIGGSCGSQSADAAARRPTCGARATPRCSCSIPASVHYIKGKAREQRPSMQCSPWNAVFDVTVTDVLADASDPHREGESFVRGGVPFYCDPSWAAGRRCSPSSCPTSTDDICHPPPPDRRHHRRQRHHLRHPPARAAAGRWTSRVT